MIFLCFSSSDRYTVVQSCLYHLKRYGIDVWYDYHELVLGDNKEIKNFQYAIEKSKYYIIIYSPHFFNSPCAVNEERLIFERQSHNDINIFPILFNITIEDLPGEYGSKVSELIYNEITDATGSLNTINQVVCRILLNDYGVSTNSVTPAIATLDHYQYSDTYISCLINKYKKVDPENFNARAALILALFKYITINYECNIPKHYSSIVEYLTDYTNFSIRFNHKELTILELIVLICLQKVF